MSNQEIKFLIEAPNKNNCGVYIITNKRNNRFYIGSTINLATRHKEHQSDLKHNKHHNRFLQADWNVNNKQFIFSLLEFGQENNRLIIEQKWLNKLSNDQLCYNHIKTTNKLSRRTWSNTTEETSKKISAIIKKNWENPTYRQNQISKLQKYSFKPKTYKLLDPNGNIQIITNISEYCRQNPQYKKQGLIMLDKEKIKSYKGWTKPNPITERIKNMNLQGAKEWKFLSPEGNITIIVNLLKFCREHNLNCPSMFMVYTGQRNSHKGWKST